MAILIRITKQKNDDLVSGMSIIVPVGAWWRTGARRGTSSSVMKVKLPALQGRACGALAGQPPIEKKREWAALDTGQIL